MATVLAYTSPARGHLYPLVPILDELRARGHQIAVRSLAAETAMLRERGFDAAPIAAHLETIALQDWRERGARKALQQSVRGFAERASFDAADLRAAIEQHRPDAVLVDVNCWGAAAAAEHWDGPWASFCPYPLALPATGVPPFGPGLVPARGRAGLLRDALIRPVVTGAIERVMLPPVNAVRAEVGLPALRGVAELLLAPPLTIYLTAEPFEYHRDRWPDSVVLVGPCAWEPPVDPPDWLAGLTDPLVLVTTSSEFQDDGRLVQVAVRALAAEPFQVVATLPAGEPAGKQVAHNAHLARFISHAAVLDRAVCAITHGGMGATQKALARGVPVCAVPFGRDQFEVARRVEQAGAGVRLPAKRLREDRLRAAVRAAIELRPGAQRVAAGFAAAGGPVAAANAIEQRILGDRLR